MLKLLVGFLIDLIKNSMSAISYVYISGNIKIYQSGFVVICIIIKDVFIWHGVEFSPNCWCQLGDVAIIQVNNMLM